MRKTGDSLSALVNFVMRLPIRWSSPQHIKIPKIKKGEKEMGNGELAAVVQELERTICRNNNMCRREMNARLTGDWYLTIDAVKKIRPPFIR